MQKIIDVLTNHSEWILLGVQIITSLGTIVALCAFTYQIYKDRKAEKWNQASHISCWFDGDRIIISNTSSQPIYNAKVFIQMVDRMKVNHSHDNEYKHVQCIPPGDFFLEYENEYVGMNKIFNAAIAFRDANGKHWVRNAAGILKKDTFGRKGKLLHMPEGSEYIERINYPNGIWLVSLDQNVEQDGSAADVER